MAPFFLLLLSLLCERSAAELIASLPGQPGNVTFKQHSGYIVTDAQHGHALFYYFVEAEAKNPSKLPLTLWLNGGPGCSSLGFGAFMENGPFQVEEKGFLQKNKYSWNSVSNMLYVESPIGVGFSYSNTSSDYIDWDDAKTAQDNLNFIINWLQQFPEYQDSDLYLTGESYAGHYIPQLASLMIEHNKKQDRPIKLKAIALGNPLLDPEISIDTSEFMWWHGLISDEMLTITKTVCNDSRMFQETMHNNVSKECVGTFDRLLEEIGYQTDSGDMLAPLCLSSTSATQASAFLGDLANLKMMNTALAGDPCLGDRTFEYLNDTRVQQAFHVKTTKTPASWSFCSGPLSYKQVDIAANVIPLLKDILREPIPVLLYSGDQDLKIPLTQTRKIANLVAKDLKLSVLGKYGPWYDGLQIAGSSEWFGEFKNGKNSTILTYATVRGAAHEVPFTSPSQALTMFKAFIGGDSLPRRFTNL